MATLWQVEQFFDDTGAPLTSGVIEAYIAGTSTPKNMFADQTGTPLGTTYTLSSSGRVPSTGIWLDGAYKLIIKDSGGSVLYTLDNVEEYDSLDFTGLTATIADLNSTSTTTLLKTSTYTVQVGDRGKTILANASSGNMTINLPAVTTAGNKFVITIKKIDVSTNLVTIDPSGSQQIEGLTTYVLWNYFDSVILHCDNSVWHIVAVKLRDTVQSITASRELKLANDVRLFLCDATTAQIDLKLPSPPVVGRGWRVGAKKTDSSTNSVVFTQNGSETIDGAPSYTLGNQNEASELLTDGVDWYVVNNIISRALEIGSLTGFQIEQDSGDTNHDIKVSPGTARTVDNLYDLRTTTSFVKRIDASWAEGTGQGGFPTGLTLSANTDYFFFGIVKTDGQVDFGFDSNLDANKLLLDATDYVGYFRIPTAYVRTDGSLNITPFVNRVNASERRYIWTDIIAEVSGFSLTKGSLSIVTGLRTPVGIITNVSSMITVTNGGSISPIGFFSYDVTTLTATPTTIIAQANTNGNGYITDIYTGTNSNIKYYAEGTLSTLDISTLSWSE